MRLKFTIKGQELHVQTPSVMVSDTVRYFGADFSFMTKAWEGLEKYAHFSDGSHLHDVLLTDDSIEENEGLNFGAGNWTCWVHGAKREGEELKMQILTNMVTFKVEQGGAIDGEPFPTVLPSVGEQIIARATAEADRSAEAAGLSEDYAESSSRYATTSRNHAVSAETSATNAGRSAEQADRHEQKALEYTEEAETFADRAEDSMFNAETYASNARTAETEARKAEEAAKQAAEDAKQHTYDDTELRGRITEAEEEVSALNDGLAKKADKSEITDFVKNTDYANATKAGVLKAGNGIAFGQTGIPQAVVYTTDLYNARGDVVFVSKGTLENVLAERLKEPQFELIEEIVLDTDTPSIKKNTEPNGTPYNFKDLLLSIAIPPQTGATSRIIQFYCDGKSIGRLQSMGHATYTCYGSIRFFAKNGRVFCPIASMAYNAIGNVSSVFSQPNGIIGEIGQEIKELRIVPYNSTLPVGTNIKIYAIRA